MTGKYNVHRRSFRSADPSWENNCTCVAAGLVHQGANQSSGINKCWTLANAILDVSMLERSYEGPQRYTRLHATVDETMEPDLPNISRYRCASTRGIGGGMTH